MTIARFILPSGTVCVNPKVGFGRPLVDGAGISAYTLSEAVEIEGGVEQAAKAYGVEVEHVKTAQEYVKHMNEWNE